MSLPPPPRKLSVPLAVWLVAYSWRCTCQQVHRPAQQGRSTTLLAAQRLKYHVPAGIVSTGAHAPLLSRWDLYQHVSSRMQMP